MRIFARTSAALLLLLTAGAAGALEISLEENRAERGNIGYVDLQRVFRLYPETHQARQSYAEVVRQAEEQVNLKKAELYTMREELTRLRMERRLLTETPIAPKPADPKASQETLPEALQNLPGMDIDMGIERRGPDGKPIEEGKKETEASEATGSAESSGSPEVQIPGDLKDAVAGEDTADDSVTIDIPGLTEVPIVQETGAAASDEEPAPLPVEKAAPPAPVTPAGTPTEQVQDRLRKQRLEELNALIRTKERELAGKEAEFREYRREIEQNLLEIESRRSEILLGKIYTSLRRVARENGVSVVVDKRQILLGQDSVDLTEKVLERLGRKRQWRSLYKRSPNSQELSSKEMRPL